MGGANPGPVGGGKPLGESVRRSLVLRFARFGSARSAISARRHGTRNHENSQCDPGTKKLRVQVSCVLHGVWLLILANVLSPVINLRTERGANELIQTTRLGAGKIINVFEQSDDELLRLSVSGKLAREFCHPSNY